MKNGRKDSTVSVGMMRILKKYATRYGVDFHSIADDTGFDLSMLHDGEARVPGSLFQSMWLQITAKNSDRHPGLHFGQEMARSYPGGSIVFTMMINTGTIGAAIDTFIQYHRIMADVIQPQLRNDGDRVHLSWNVLQKDLAPDRVISEALLCTYFLILEHLSEGQIRPIQVSFIHRAPEDQTEYESIFKCPLLFQAKANQLTISKNVLDLPIHLANPELFKILENYASRIASSLVVEQSWSRKVMESIGEMIVKGNKPELKTVSKQLAQSCRSLQGKLAEEHTGFRECLGSVRKQIALDYLARPNVTIGEVTFLLGYSEQSAFNHAFKRWTGKTPREYRLDP